LNGIGGFSFGINYNKKIKANFFQIGFNTTYFSRYPTLLAVNLGIGKKAGSEFFMVSVFSGPSVNYGYSINNLNIRNHP
jgi:hypothetical protein